MSDVGMKRRIVMTLPSPGLCLVHSRKSTKMAVRTSSSATTAIVTAARTETTPMLATVSHREPLAWPPSPPPSLPMRAYPRLIECGGAAAERRRRSVVAERTSNRNVECSANQRLLLAEGSFPLSR